MKQFHEMNEEEKDFVRWFNSEVIAIKDLTLEELNNRRKEIAEYVRDSRARLIAIDEEIHRRNKRNEF